MVIYREAATVKREEKCTACEGVRDTERKRASASMECIDTRIISSRARSRHNLYKILELYALCIFKDEKFALDGCVIVTKAIGEQEAAR